MRTSHSKTELYNLCPAKFRFKYIDKLEPNKTFSALLFGGAIDKALNYILTRTKRKHIVYADTTKRIFTKNMNKWQGQNELVFFKNEMPYENSSQEEVWRHLVIVGYIMIDTYISEILPMFAEILSVQTKREIPNAEGDILVLITDFTARLHDGRVVTFDNKTSTDIKKNYGPKSVAKSQQLAIYTEFEESKLAGYIALSKRLKDGKVEWVSVVDTILEEQAVIAFEKVDQALRGIKNEEFPCNPKACYSFGKPCDYMKYCKYNDDSGLVSSKRK